MKSLRIILIYIIIWIGAISQKSEKTNDLESQFLNPSTSAKPYVWWHWMGSNFSKEGITRDLEAMKAVGIGGATIFNITSAVQETHSPTENNPWPWQTYRSSAYWDAIKFAATEANRLGLELGLHNTVGYSTTGGPWITEERGMQKLVWSNITVNGEKNITFFLDKPVLPLYEGYGSVKKRASFYKDIAVLAVPDTSGISLKDVVDLTLEMDSSGYITWNPPAGKWTIYRIGHSPTMANPHPLPDDLIGKTLEVDKMSLEQNTFHWKSVIDPVKEHLGNLVGSSFKHMLIDSYEAGNQNWTPKFREEFIKRKGYDPVPWIISFGPPITNDRQGKLRRIVGSKEQTQRFEWDYYDVIHQLFYDNGWKIGKKLLHEAHLDLQFEPYTGPFDSNEGAALADIPMVEFWTGGKGGILANIPAAARAAGKKIVGAEAFTGMPEASQWTEDPAFLKISTDGAFGSGVNRLILHQWVHQPFSDNYQPGMGMGWWGTHFNRHQTWFEPGKAYFSYLARCQVMLQHGEQVADYLCIDKQVGFSDIISKNDFLRMDIKIQNGRIVLPSGRKYPFLVFSGREMLPEVALKIKEIVGAGGTVVSVKPITSPSLKDFPACDDDLKKTCNELWGNNPVTVYQKGRVFKRLEDAIADFNIEPDYIIEKAIAPSDLKVIHRTSPDADIYFVANLYDNPQSLRLSLRISGRQPELWQAEDASVTDAPVWVEKAGRTLVDLNLGATQSIFVVFRKKPTGKDHPVLITDKDSTTNWSVHTDNSGSPVIRSSMPLKVQVVYSSGKMKDFILNSQPSIEISGAWTVSFAPKLDEPFVMEFPQLIDFSKHSNKVVKYFSGTATYNRKVTLSKKDMTTNQRWLLDLGKLNDLAEIKVNGKSVRIVWYPPYKADITDFIRPGENDLQIAVTNNWANRLIGDEQEPADFEWGADRGPEKGRAMKGFPEWFIKGQPRPSKGRKSFSIWYYYRENSLLQPAGLVGPVLLIRQTEIKI